MSASTRRPLWQPLTAVAAVLVMALAVVLVVIASTSDDQAPAATASATSAAPNGQPERVTMRPVALDGMREADPDAQGPVWADCTGRNIGRSTALVLDSTVLSVASIQSRIGGTMDLSGEFTEQEAKALANAFTGGR